MCPTVAAGRKFLPCVFALCQGRDRANPYVRKVELVQRSTLMRFLDARFCVRRFVLRSHVPAEWGRWSRNDKP